MDDQFQVALPSNSSLDHYPKNKPNNFTTRFSEPFSLDGEWETALIDLQYQFPKQNWQQEIKLGLYTRIQTEQVIQPTDSFGKLIVRQLLEKNIHDHYEKSDLDISPWHKNKVYIDSREYYRPSLSYAYGYRTLNPGYFRSISQFCDKINTLLKEIHEAPPTLTYLANEDRVELVGKSFGLVSDTPLLFHRLGLKFETVNLTGEVMIDADATIYVVKAEKSVKGELPPELDVPKLLFLYSDIIKYQTVGDIKAPMIAVLPVKGEVGQQCYWACQPPYFFPVSKNDFDTINIQLRTDSGDPFPVDEQSKVIARLHFRRRRLV